MTKASNLLNRLGSSLGESIGIRQGEPNQPQYAAGQTPKTDFVRNRSVGEISPSEVMPDPNQPRKHFDEEELQNLANDITARGQLQPIRVRWSVEHSKWLIIAGERRWRAVSKAGLPKITCMFIDRELSENEIRSEQLVENLLREDLNGLELAKSFKALMDLNGWKATELSKNLNVSNAKVSRALALLKLPEDLQAQIELGKISPAAAYEMAKVKDESKQRELAEKAVAEGLTQAAAKTASAEATGKVRKSTFEQFKTTENVRVVISSRRELSGAQLVDALLEVAEILRKRKGSSRAA